MATRGSAANKPWLRRAQDAEAGAVGGKFGGFGGGQRDLAGGGPFGAAGERDLEAEAVDGVDVERDLAANAVPYEERLGTRPVSVESAVAAPPHVQPDVVIVDPPRTGLSPEVVAGLLTWQTSRLVYVSCDVPTLARDANRLLAGGYRLSSVEALDMFPDTPHVECVAIFDR